MCKVFQSLWCISSLDQELSCLKGVLFISICLHISPVHICSTIPLGKTDGIKLGIDHPLSHLPLKASHHYSYKTTLPFHLCALQRTEEQMVMGRAGDRVEQRFSKWALGTLGLFHGPRRSK